MNWHNIKKRYVIALLVSVVRVAMPQYPLPMAMPMVPPPLMPMPQPPPSRAILPPVHVVPLEMPKQRTTTTKAPSSIGSSGNNNNNNNNNDHNGNDVAVAIPIPIPAPMQIAVPALPTPSFCAKRPNAPQCPPCPPCLCKPACTPSFFSYCSSCHLKCRCRPGDQVPEPLPAIAPSIASGPAFPMPVNQIPFGMPPGSPMFGVPVPNGSLHRKQKRKVKKRHFSFSDSDSDSNSDTDSDTDSDDTDTDSDTDSDTDNSCDKDKTRRRAGHGIWHRRTKTKKSRGHLKRHPRRRVSSQRRNIHRNMPHNQRIRSKQTNFIRRHYDSHEGIIKPVISFVNDFGEVKMKQTLSDRDVAVLMKDKNIMRNNKKHMRTNQIIMRSAPKKEPTQTIRVYSNLDENEPTLIVQSDNNEKTQKTKQKKDLRKKAALVIDPKRKVAPTNPKAMKKIYFKTPQGQTISNLSLTFHVT